MTRKGSDNTSIAVILMGFSKALECIYINNKSKLEVPIYICSDWSQMLKRYHKVQFTSSSFQCLQKRHSSYLYQITQIIITLITIKYHSVVMIPTNFSLLPWKEKTLNIMWPSTNRKQNYIWINNTKNKNKNF